MRDKILNALLSVLSFVNTVLTVDGSAILRIENTRWNMVTWTTARVNLCAHASWDESTSRWAATNRSGCTPYGCPRASEPERLANRVGNIGLPRGAYRGEPNQLNAGNGNVQSFASHICHGTVLETPQRDCEWLIIKYC